MNQVVADTLRGIKFVKSMVLEQTQSQKLRLLNQESLGIWGKNAVLENLAGLWINDFSNTIFTGVAFGVAALLIVKGEMTLGNPGDFDQLQRTFFHRSPQSNDHQLSL